MAEVLSSIGTDTRDYATVTSYIAATYGGATGSDNAIGELYNDSVFDESWSVSDGTPIDITIRTATGQGHTGVSGSGARFVQSSAKVIGVGSLFATPTLFQGFELDANSTTSNFNCNGSTVITLDGCIFHGTTRSSGILTIVQDVRGNLYNNIVYGGLSTASQRAIGIQVSDATSATLYHNVSYGMTNNSASNVAYNIQLDDNLAAIVLRNNIAMGAGGTTSGAKEDFHFAGTTIDGDYNLSGDDTADDAGGSNDLVSQTDTSIFVSVASGLEDFHIKSGSNAIGAGENLGSGEWADDIDGFDRTSMPPVVDWDIGVHQLNKTAPSAFGITGPVTNTVSAGCTSGITNRSF